tara:strand:+ start:2716 stop:3960 length:1245 start_codon:yes stop_codon:yes gene_type:complete
LKKLKEMINKNKIISWSLYDFASQPFSTIVVTFVFSSFFTKHIAYDEKIGTQMWSNAIAISAVIVAVVSPFFGAIADNTGRKKLFLVIFTMVSSLFTCMLYTPEKGEVYFALILFIIANVSFEICTIFYNSYLPEITNSKNRGTVSGFAWGLGYLGGILSLLLLQFFLDLENTYDIKLSNIYVGIWFIIFSIPLCLIFKDSKKARVQKDSLKNSYLSIKNTIKTISDYKIILRFLIARLFYNDALITIFGLGGIYAVTTLDFNFNEVVSLAIVLNIAAGIGAFIFGFFEDKYGPKKIIIISIWVLIIATLIAFIAPQTNYPKKLFWLSGILIGLMAGPNQSSSRSLMSILVPEDKKSQFFGFYSLTGKITSFIGPLLFGIITFYFNQQIALWVVIILFSIGLFLFSKIETKNID